MKTLCYFLLLIIITSCVANDKYTKAARQRMRSLDPDTQSHINTLLDKIKDQGSIAYDFTIPLDSVKKAQVYQIDPSLHFRERKTRYDCFGRNATREKVLRIVALPYTYKIREHWFE